MGPKPLNDLKNCLKQSRDVRTHPGDHEVDLLGHLACVISDPLEVLDHRDVVGADVRTLFVLVDEVHDLDQVLAHGPIEEVVHLRDLVQTIDSLLIKRLGDDLHHADCDLSDRLDEVDGLEHRLLAEILGRGGDVVAVLPSAPITTGEITVASPSTVETFKYSPEML